jgi:protein TonB
LQRVIQFIILLATAACASGAGPTLLVVEAEAKKAAIEKPAPEYPLVARQLKVVGKVSLEGLVSAEGLVTEVRIISGNPILTKPAAEALRKWKFRPFKEDGKPAPAIISLSFEFDTH